MSLELIDDKELWQSLNKSVLAVEFLQSDQGKLLREGASRVADRAIHQLCYDTDLNNLALVIELITTIRKYKYELFRELEALKNESELFFEEAKSRDLIPADGSRNSVSGQSP